MRNLPRRRTLLAATGVALLGLLPACAEDDTTASTAPTATAAPTASTTPTPTGGPGGTEGTTTTSAPPPTAAPTTTGPPATAVPGSGAPEGSGCTPGTSETLPDGRWFGSLETLGTTELSFDLACWFTGENATIAAAEDGEESPPPNDYYVRNENPAIRTLPVAADAQSRWYPEPGDPSTVRTTRYTDWVAAGTERYFGVWLTVGGGAVTLVEEQWVP